MPTLPPCLASVPPSADHPGSTEESSASWLPPAASRCGAWRWRTSALFLSMLSEDLLGKEAHASPSSRVLSTETKCPLARSNPPGRACYTEPARMATPLPLGKLRPALLGRLLNQ